MDFYRELQTVKYKSFESSIARWVDGQNRFLNDYLKADNTELSILDVGCGEGCGLDWLWRNSFTHVVGCDLDLEKASKALTLSGFPTCTTDIHSMPFKDGHFDIVYTSHVLEHAHDPKRVVKELHRILKLNGVLIIVVPFPDFGPDECHCGKYQLRTDPTSADSMGATGIVDFFKNSFSLLEYKLDQYREPEIWLRLKRNNVYD